MNISDRPVHGLLALGARLEGQPAELLRPRRIFLSKAPLQDLSDSIKTKRGVDVFIGLDQFNIVLSWLNYILSLDQGANLTIV